MSNLVGSIFGNMTETDADETLGVQSADGVAGLATAYLGAALGATTPEVKRLFSDYLTQALVAHGALSELTVQKGWANPYESPDHQLAVSYRAAEETLGTAH